MIGLRRGLVRGARISALGVHVPERIMTNDEISTFLDTSDEWIRQRTGIAQRHIAAEGECTSHLAAKAAERALATAGRMIVRLEEPTAGGIVLLCAGVLLGMRAFRHHLE